MIQKNGIAWAGAHWDSGARVGRRSLLKGLAFSALVATVLPGAPLTTQAATRPKVLIAYFSHTGNTKAVAQSINAAVGGDMLEIKVQEAYSPTHAITEARAEKEWQGNARPALAMTFPANMDSYDIIFVGYPNWFRTAPMGVFTFLEQFTFAGKTLAPFCTHGGNGLANGPRDMAKICPQATLLDGLAIAGRQATDAARVNAAVQGWLQKHAALASLMNK